MGRESPDSRDMLDMVIIPIAHVWLAASPRMGFWSSICTTVTLEPGFRREAVRRTGPGVFGEKS
jgi:hypothetical protein